MPNTPAANAAPARTVADSASLLIRAQAFVDRKYVTRADARQQEMGLAYVEAERQDLAREIARFVASEIAALPREVALLDSLAPEGLAVDKQPTGYTASIFYALREDGVGDWSPRVFAGTASEAIAKALKLHGVRASEVVTPVPICPPSPSAASVSIAPPPY